MEANPYQSPCADLTPPHWRKRRERFVAWVVDRALLCAAGIGIAAPAPFVKSLGWWSLPIVAMGWFLGFYFARRYMPEYSSRAADASLRSEVGDASRSNFA